VSAGISGARRESSGGSCASSGGSSCLVLTTFAAAAYTATRHKEYEATAKLLLQTENVGGTIAGTGLGAQDPNRQAATDAQLVSLPSVAARVTRQLGEPLRTAAVRTSTGSDSNLLNVTVTDRDPKRAARFANEFGRQFIGFRRDTTRERYKRALRTVQTQLAQARPKTPDFIQLRAQVKQLRLLVSLQTGDAQLVQQANVPRAAVRPKPVRNIALGVIFGLLLGLALAFLRDRLDRRIKNEEQLDAFFPGVPIVALVPEPRRRRASRLMTAEGYHTLQANLRLLVRDRPLQTLLITSATPGEGKSTVALNLALAANERGQTALVLDADLRRPSLTERLKADRRVGVASILAGEGSVATSVQERPAEASRNGKGPSIALDGDLQMVSAGPPASNVQLLVNDRSLHALLEESRTGSEVVVFDGPPVGSFADMLPLAKEVDGVLLVVRLYYSRSDQLRRLSDQLANASIKPLGIVVLGTASGPSRYYSDYLAKR
jgi:capsular exopolysaccharide synthesis family protein